MPIDNQPLYNGVPIGKLIDTPIYANANLNAYGNDLKTPKAKYKKGDFIGNLWSWSTTNGTVYMEFYLTNADYQNFNITKVPFATDSSFKVPQLPEIKKEIEAKKDAAEDANKSWYEKYIEKYAPWLIGAAVVWIALPTVRNTLVPAVRRRVGGRTGTDDNILLIAGAGALTVWLMTRKEGKQLQVNQLIPTIQTPENTYITYDVVSGRTKAPLIG